MRPYTCDDKWSAFAVVIIYKDIAVNITYIRLRRSDDMGVTDSLGVARLGLERTSAILHMVAGIAHTFHRLLRLAHGGGGHYLVFVFAPFGVVDEVLIILPIDIYLRFDIVPEDILSRTHVLRLEHDGVVIAGIHLVFHIDAFEVVVAGKARVGKVDADPCVCVGTGGIARAVCEGYVLQRRLPRNSPWCDTHCAVVIHFADIIVDNGVPDVRHGFGYLNMIHLVPILSHFGLILTVGGVDGIIPQLLLPRIPAFPCSIILRMGNSRRTEQSEKYHLQPE